MIDRNLTFAVRDGEFAIDSSSDYSWVGGAPVGLDASGNITAEFAVTGAIGYMGVAWHSQAEAIAKDSLVSVIYPPARITIKKGVTSWPDGADVDDAYSPWDESRTYAIGQLLRPLAKSDGGVYYSVWTNATLTDLGSYFARIVGMEGSGSAPTSLTIVIGSFPVVAA